MRQRRAKITQDKHTSTQLPLTACRQRALCCASCPIQGTEVGTHPRALVVRAP